MKSPTLPCTLLPKIGHVKHGLPGSSSVPGEIPLNQELMFKAMFWKTFFVEEETSGSGTASSGRWALGCNVFLLRLSFSKHKANTTELHPKVRQTCSVLYCSVWCCRCSPTSPPRAARPSTGARTGTSSSASRENVTSSRHTSQTLRHTQHRGYITDNITGNMKSKVQTSLSKN